MFAQQNQQKINRKFVDAHWGHNLGCDNADQTSPGNYFLRRDQFCESFLSQNLVGNGRLWPPGTDSHSSIRNSKQRREGFHIFETTTPIISRQLEFKFSVKYDEVNWHLAIKYVTTFHIFDRWQLTSPYFMISVFFFNLYFWISLHISSSTFAEPAFSRTEYIYDYWHKCA